MSGMRYITAITHVVTDSAAASELASKIAQLIGRDDWDADDWGHLSKRAMTSRSPKSMLPDPA